MSGTNCVKVMLLKQFDILQHSFSAHGMTGFWMMFVAVSTSNQNRFAIDLKQAIGDFYTTETHVVGFAIKLLVTIK